MKTTLTAIALCTVLATGVTSVEAACNTCAPVCNTCAPRAVCQPMERVCKTTSCCNPCGSEFNLLNPFSW